MGFLDDRGDGVSGFAEDAAIAGRVGKDGGENGGRGVGGFVFLDERAKGFRADQGRIARENNDESGVADFAPGNQQGVAGALLRLLQDGGDIEGFDGCGDFFSLMTDNGDDFFWVERQASAHNVLHDGAATGVMQHFGETRLEASAFARGENEDSDVFVGHGGSIVYWDEGFDNAGIERRRGGQREN